MAQRKRGERILGPYHEPARDRWRVVEVAANGDRSSSFFETEAKADRYVELIRAALKVEDYDTETALDEYARHLRDDKGNKPGSVAVTRWAIEMFFPTPIPLHMLRERRVKKLYDELRTRPKKVQRNGKWVQPDEGPPVSVDTHRNILAQVKTFLAWCSAQGWTSGNPAAGVKGVGKRRPRGKSLGKEGNTLRVKEARKWYAKALELAEGGDERATGALVACLLGMRASEIVSRIVHDLDEDEEPGDLLWIPCAKTPAGRRTLEVPEPLRPLLVAAAEGKDAERYLFEAKPGEPHARDWPRKQVKRICRVAGVPEVTAHAMRGLLATLTKERGLAGHLVAATLGHADEKVADLAYAEVGAADAGTRRRGLKVLKGGKGA